MEKTIYTPASKALQAKLRSLRKTAGITQRALADKLGRVHSFVTRMEQGQRRLDVLEFIRVCQALKVDPPEVLADLLREMRRIKKMKS